MIDVIIPAYNCEKTLHRTLSSLAAQTDPDFHVIIVDDCSTQDIKYIADEYATRLNITYIRNESNLGCGMSRQVGIDHASAKFFTFLDSDDMFMPYTVETFNAIIKENPNTQMIHSYFYEQCMIDRDPALRLRKDGYTWMHGKLYNMDFIKKFNITFPNAFMNYAEDTYFNSICCELLDFKIVRVPLVLWANNPDSITRKIDLERDKHATEMVLRALLDSAAFVMQYKNNINHLNHTLALMEQNSDKFTENETMLYNELQNYLQKG